jgi:hypothetical protein
VKSKARKAGLLCAHLVEVSMVGEEQSQRKEGLLEQISRARATISLECPVRRGTNVRVDCGTCELRGRVAGCRFAGSEYQAEVDFAADSQWSHDNFRPDHLFNPASLTCQNPACTPACVNESCTEPPQSEKP